MAGSFLATLSAISRLFSQALSYSYKVHLQPREALPDPGIGDAQGEWNLAGLLIERQSDGRVGGTEGHRDWTSIPWFTPPNVCNNQGQAKLKWGHQELLPNFIHACQGAENPGHPSLLCQVYQQGTGSMWSSQNSNRWSDTGCWHCKRRLNVLCHATKPAAGSPASCNQGKTSK